MSAEHLGRVGEGGKFLKTEHDIVITTTFQVCTSATATEKGVTREEHIVFFCVEADAAT